MSLNYSHQKSGKQNVIDYKRVTFASCSYPPKSIPNIGFFFLYSLCRQMTSMQNYNLQ